MNIIHDTENCRLWCEERGHIAYLRYEITDKQINIVTTYVPAPLGGQGVASRLMQEIWNYANEQGLTPIATCSYAKVWLERYSVNA